MLLRDALLLPALLLPALLLPALPPCSRSPAPQPPSKQSPPLVPVRTVQETIQTMESSNLGRMLGEYYVGVAHCCLPNVALSVLREGVRRVTVGRDVLEDAVRSLEAGKGVPEWRVTIGHEETPPPTPPTPMAEDAAAGMDVCSQDSPSLSDLNGSMDTRDFTSELNGSMDTREMTGDVTGGSLVSLKSSDSPPPMGGYDSEGEGCFGGGSGQVRLKSDARIYFRKTSGRLPLFTHVHGAFLLVHGWRPPSLFTHLPPRTPGVTSRPRGALLQLSWRVCVVRCRSLRR